MLEDKRRNPVLASLFVLLVVALLGLPFVRVAPNRLVSGQAVYFSSIAIGVVWLLLAMLCVAVMVALLKPRRLWLGVVLAISAVLIPGMLWLAASHATLAVQAAASIARTSFGGAFWLSVFCWCSWPARRYINCALRPGKVQRWVRLCCWP
jgi:osmoprotectant transport system permease protein